MSPDSSFANMEMQKQGEVLADLYAPKTAHGGTALTASSSLRVAVFIIIFLVGLVLFVVFVPFVVVVLLVWRFSNLDSRTYPVIRAVRGEVFWTHSPHAQWYALVRRRWYRRPVRLGFAEQRLRVAVDRSETAPRALAQPIPA